MVIAVTSDPLMPYLILDHLFVTQNKTVYREDSKVKALTVIRKYRRTFMLR